jgi:hypothetical protein
MVQQPNTGIDQLCCLHLDAGGRPASSDGSHPDIRRSNHGGLVSRVQETPKVYEDALDQPVGFIKQGSRQSTNQVGKKGGGEEGATLHHPTSKREP